MVGESAASQSPQAGTPKALGAWFYVSQIESEKPVSG